ncbi:MAG TPA: DUF1877 family protein [Kofleriaceae bacterium]|nr:DUF1877 family protein [Kofleriaceae bacterium]
MSTTHGILIALSSKRLALLQNEPETLEDVIEARHEDEIPGLLDMSTHWETLDMLVSGRGRDPVLGDVFLARSGKPLSVDTAFEQALVLGPQRVAEVAAKLAEVPVTLVRERYAQLEEAKNPGKPVNVKKQAEIELLYEEIVDLYVEAAKQKQSMLAVLV